jgi:hypothetical protein
MQGNPGMEEATTKKNVLTLDYSSSLCVDSSKVVELETLDGGLAVLGHGA